MWSFMQAAGFALFLSSPAAAATNVTVEMLNKDPVTAERNVYSEDIVRVDVGDSVTWLATDVTPTGRGSLIVTSKGVLPALR